MLRAVLFKTALYIFDNTPCSNRPLFHVPVCNGLDVPTIQLRPNSGK